MEGGGRENRPDHGRQRECPTVRVLAKYMADLGSNFGTTYDPPRTAGVIHEQSQEQALNTAESNSNLLLPPQIDCFSIQCRILKTDAIEEPFRPAISQSHLMPQGARLHKTSKNLCSRKLQFGNHWPS